MEFGCDAMAPGAPLDGQIKFTARGCGVPGCNAKEGPKPRALLGDQVYGQAVGFGVTQWNGLKGASGWSTLRPGGMLGCDAMAPGAPLGGQVYNQGVCFGVTQRGPT